MQPYVEGSPFAQKFVTGDVYRSPRLRPSLLNMCLPSPSFYCRLLAGPLGWLCHRAAHGRCDDTAWVYASVWVAEIMEHLGCPITIEGMDALHAFPGPCVIVANHMSTLETFMLPGIIRPRKAVTFVVKRSLTTMPWFGPVMRSRDPVIVDRRKPREDLVRILEDGTERLNRNISIIVFPQHTRSYVFDTQLFNSIGVKLARKAGVPVVPLALKTDAWGQGKHFKECGPIASGMPIRYCFGEALQVHGQGRKEHQAICHHIATCLHQWNALDGVNR